MHGAAKSERAKAPIVRLRPLGKTLLSSVYCLRRRSSAKRPSARPAAHAEPVPVLLQPMGRQTPPRSMEPEGQLPPPVPPLPPETTTVALPVAVALVPAPLTVKATEPLVALDEADRVKVELEPVVML